MSDLISGKEALKHIADGNAVMFQYKTGSQDNWTEIQSFSEYSLDEFLDDEYFFKLKPKTITINGIEVPAPFEPKKGDGYWYLSQNGIGYSSLIINHSGDSSLGIGCWKSEEEIKQVVAALRSIFNVK